jgi:hypothetical protein
MSLFPESERRRDRREERNPFFLSYSSPQRRDRANEGNRRDFRGNLSFLSSLLSLLFVRLGGSHAPL